MSRALKAAALAALLAAAAAAAETVSRHSASHTLEHRTTETKRFDLRVPDSRRRVSLTVKGKLTAGEVRIVVRDAAGRVRQDARIGPAKSKPNVYNFETGEVASPAGVWTVEFDFKDALGTYGYTFTLTDRTNE